MCRKPMTLLELKFTKNCNMSMLPNKNSSCLSCRYHVSHVSYKNDNASLGHYDIVYSKPLEDTNNV